MLDANLLLYAYDELSPDYPAAKAWLVEILSGDELVGLPWQSIGAFLRVMTNRRLPGLRFTPEEAMVIVGSWLAIPGVKVLSPGERHLLYLREMVVSGQATGPLVSDAQLAALTVEHGGYLCTADRDFGRFPGLRWGNPLLERAR